MEKRILMQEEVNFTEKEKSSIKIESLTYELLVSSSTYVELKRVI